VGTTSASGLLPTYYSGASDRGEPITYVTRDIRVAENALAYGLQVALPAEVDPGIVESGISQRQFDTFLKETPCVRFFPYVPGGTEIEI
jgi:hypothetical protein